LKADLQEDYTLLVLPNGLRVVHKYAAETRLGHCAFSIRAGSRDEEVGQWGMAHFIEHLIFKGTGKRKAFHVLNRLDVVGGDLNAYTTKEVTVVHASFLDAHLERAMELLADVVGNPSFPEKEIDKEKGVILDEIAGYRDNPEESLLDDFEEQLFGSHPLAHNILGTAETLEGMTRAQVLTFYAQHYGASNAVFSYVGPTPLAAFERLCKRWLEALPPSTGKPAVRTASLAYLPKQETLTTQHTQAYYCLGCPAPAAHDPKRYALWLLNNLLGGDAMNSRLNLNIREKHGLVYSIEGIYTAYGDSGMWGVLFSTDADDTARVMALVEKELEKLRNTALGTRQLTEAKTQLTTRVLMAEESRASLCMALGKAVLDKGFAEPVEEIIGRLNRLTAADLQAMANQLWQPNTLSLVAYRPHPGKE